MPILAWSVTNSSAILHITCRCDPGVKLLSQSMRPLSAAQFVVRPLNFKQLTFNWDLLHSDSRPNGAWLHQTSAGASGSVTRSHALCAPLHFLLTGVLLFHLINRAGDSTIKPQGPYRPSISFTLKDSSFVNYTTGSP